MEQLIIPLGREDLLTPSFPIGQEDTISLHMPSVSALPCVWLTFRSAQWHIIDVQAWRCTPISNVSVFFNTHRVVVFTQEEAHILQSIEHSLEHLVVLEWDLWVETALLLSDEVWFSTVLQVRKEIEMDMHVDYARFSSSQHAWRHRAHRRMNRDWSTATPASLERWMQHVHDHPWQEVRHVASRHSRAGIVMDMNKAYSYMMEMELYPYPGPWSLHNQFIRHPCALYQARFTPTDAMGSTFHAWRIHHPNRRYYCNLSGHILQGWFLMEDLAWMSRHGKVEVAYTAIPNQYGKHPLSNFIRAWKNAIPSAHKWLKRSWKYKLSSAHTWTWSPHYTIREMPFQEAWRSYLAEYGGRPGFRRDRWNERGESVRWSSLDSLRSGWYFPLMWTRLHVRTKMLHAVEIGLQHGLNCDYINIDGIHWSYGEKESGVINNVLDKLESRFSSLWRVDTEYEDAVHLSPGIYSLQTQHQWSRNFAEEKSSWASNLVRVQGILSMTNKSLHIIRHQYTPDPTQIVDANLEHDYLQWLSRYMHAVVK